MQIVKLGFLVSVLGLTSGCELPEGQTPEKLAVEIAEVVSDAACESLIEEGRTDNEEKEIVRQACLYKRLLERVVE